MTVHVGNWGRAIALLGAIGLLALLVGLMAPSAEASYLSKSTAKRTAAGYAHRACYDDPYCVAWGVRQLVRRTSRIVDATIFNKRRTRYQGVYFCKRTIRLVKKGGHVGINAQLRWDC